MSQTCKPDRGLDHVLVIMMRRVMSMRRVMMKMRMLRMMMMMIKRQYQVTTEVWPHSLQPVVESFHDDDDCDDNFKDNYN